MQKVIAVINQKGGVGKTACAYNLAYSFAINKRSTCLIDLDPSANATKGLNFPRNISHFSTFELLTEKGKLESYIYEIKINELYIVPSTIKLAMAQRELNAKPFRESILQKKIEGTSFDQILIDCSPTLSDLTINAIYAADFILIPVTYEDDSLEGLNDLFGVIKEIKEGHTYQYKILRNQFDARKKKTNAYIESCLQPFLEKQLVFTTVIRQDESINQAKIERKTIFQYAPHSNGAEDFKKLTEELLA